MGVRRREWDLIQRKSLKIISSSSRVSFTISYHITDWAQISVDLTCDRTKPDTRWYKSRPRGKASSATLPTKHIFKRQTIFSMIQWTGSVWWDGECSLMEHDIASCLSSTDQFQTPGARLVLLGIFTIRTLPQILGKQVSQSPLGSLTSNCASRVHRLVITHPMV